MECELNGILAAVERRLRAVGNEVAVVIELEIITAQGLKAMLSIAA
jgi:hypothetical protein